MDRAFQRLMTATAVGSGIGYIVGGERGAADFGGRALGAGLRHEILYDRHFMSREDSRFARDVMRDMSYATGYGYRGYYPGVVRPVVVYPAPPVIYREPPPVYRAPVIISSGPPAYPPAYPPSYPTAPPVGYGVAPASPAQSFPVAPSSFPQAISDPAASQSATPQQGVPDRRLATLDSSSHASGQASGQDLVAEQRHAYLKVLGYGVGKFGKPGSDQTEAALRAFAIKNKVDPDDAQAVDQALSAKIQDGPEAGVFANHVRQMIQAKRTHADDVRALQWIMKGNGAELPLSQKGDHMDGIAGPETRSVLSHFKAGPVAAAPASVEPARPVVSAFRDDATAVGAGPAVVERDVPDGAELIRVQRPTLPSQTTAPQPRPH